MSNTLLCELQQSTVNNLLTTNGIQEIFILELDSEALVLLFLEKCYLVTMHSNI